MTPPLVYYNLLGKYGTQTEYRTLCIPTMLWQHHTTQSEMHTPAHKQTTLPAALTNT